LQEKLLEYLACPACGADLELKHVGDSTGQEIMDADLACRKCDKTFPVIRGIPRFASLEKVTADKAATAENFGWQWQHFTHDEELYEQQLLGWIAPVTQAFFAGKTVLEGGCGKGRHTLLAARWGAKEVVGVDLSDAVETAFTATRELKNVHIVQADIFNLPLKRAFDYAFSVGVLHHLPDPFGGFASLATKVKPGGHLSAWIYGAENNEWITNWVNPVREKVTSRMKKPTLLQLSKLPTALLYGATKLVYRPLNSFKTGSRIARTLFYNDYLNSISKFGWKEHHTIVFDHLVAPTSHYIPRSEFERWWRALNANDVRIEWHNRNSWRGFGRL
jgi:SAM-dependent methyltransferase